MNTYSIGQVVWFVGKQHGVETVRSAKIYALKTDGCTDTVSVLNGAFRCDFTLAPGYDPVYKSEIEAHDEVVRRAEFSFNKERDKLRNAIIAQRAARNR